MKPKQILSLSAAYTHPLHRIFSFRNLLIPVAVDGFTYPAVGGGTVSFKYVYIFGIRVARWNSSK